MSRVKRHLAPLALVVLGVLLIAAASSAAPAKTRRVSVKSNGEEGAAFSGGYIDDLSDDGKVAVFISASQLTGADDNAFTDIYVRKLKTGKTVLASVRSNGNDGNELSSGPAISGNGRFVAFTSYANNLVPSDESMSRDVFVHDLKTGKTERVSIATNGDESGETGSQPSISFTGRYVAFNTGSQLSNRDNNHADDVYLRDRKTDKTELVSQTSAGVDTTDGTSENPSLSNNGRFVAFESEADDLVSNDENASDDIFVRDRMKDKTRRVSLATDDQERSGNSLDASISSNGNLIAFGSSAPFATMDDNGFSDIYLRNVERGTTTWLSRNKDGDAADGNAYYPSMSPNGRMIGFYSHANDLVGGPQPLSYRPYLYDRVKDRMIMVDRSSAGDPGNGDGYVIGISADGRFVLISSTSTELVGNDDNGVEDIFRRGPLY